MNKLNWPTAFIVSVIIVSAVFVYTKSITSTISSDDVIVPSGEQVWQLRDGRVRRCQDVEQYGSRGKRIAPNGAKIRGSSVTFGK